MGKSYRAERNGPHKNPQKGRSKDHGRRINPREAEDHSEAFQIGGKLSYPSSINTELSQMREHGIDNETEKE